MKLFFALAGLISVALGVVGIFIPLMPTTVFFVIAAWCFSRSSRRLERWLLSLPVVGESVENYRKGLGMKRRHKVSAVTSITIAVSVSALLLIDPWWAKISAAALGVVGVLYVTFAVPTTEDVIAQADEREDGTASTIQTETQA